MKASLKPLPAGRQAKISVIMSVYNGLPFLKEAVKSILNQTYKNFEFIIVDDASTDGSWQYLKGLKDKRIVLIKNKKNLGLAASLNKALQKSSSDFIARMDADDISLPERFKIQVEYLLKRADVSLCGTWVKLIDEKGNITGSIHKPTQDKEIKKMNNWITGVVHPTWLAKKNVFKELKGYDSHFDMVEDLDFLIRAKEFKMANINKELLLWRSANNRRSQKNIQEMYKRSLAVRWKYFKKGHVGLQYLPVLIRSFITTYIFPPKLKIYLNKKAGLL